MTHLFDQEAAALGAVEVGEEWILRTDHHLDYARWLFAVRYFDANGDEVAYYLPDFASFAMRWGLEALNTFESPRVWHPPYREALTLYPLKLSQEKTS